MGGRGAISYSQALTLGKEKSSLNRQLSATNSGLNKKIAERDLIYKGIMYPNISKAERDAKLSKLETEIDKRLDKVEHLEKQISTIDKKLYKYSGQKGGNIPF